MAKGKQEVLEEGMEKGRAEGKHEANTETAQRLLTMGLSAEQVAKATQLSLEIIKNLSNSCLQPRRACPRGAPIPTLSQPNTRLPCG